MANRGWKPTQPKPVPAPQLSGGRYSRRQLERLGAYARRDQRPKTQAALAEFERSGDTAGLLTFGTYPDHTINPPRPRTVAAGYDSKSHTLRMQFRNGENGRGSPGGPVYEYYRVPPTVWRNVRRVKSEGRLINRTLNAYPYKRIG